jgi:hypothetical protein
MNGLGATVHAAALRGSLSLAPQGDGFEKSEFDCRNASPHFVMATFAVAIHVLVSAGLVKRRGGPRRARA